MISYFDLLSPEPIRWGNAGGIKCPTLREISKITYSTYQIYLSVIAMTPRQYYQMTNHLEDYELLSADMKTSLHIFDLIMEDRQLISLAENALNFFLESNVKYSEPYQCFLLYETGSKHPFNAVDKHTWLSLCDVILQRNYIKQRNEDMSKIKSQRALTILQKLQKGREAREKTAKADRDMEIGNIISAVANKSKSLNIVTIWDITIYQLWDAFYRICNNNVLDIQSMSVAAWGDKNHRFDAAAWYKHLF